MNRFYAFIKGVLEFRSSVTARYEDLNLEDSYECGRSFMKFITFNKWEN